MEGVPPRPARGAPLVAGGTVAGTDVTVTQLPGVGLRRRVDLLRVPPADPIAAQRCQLAEPEGSLAEVVATNSSTTR